MTYTQAARLACRVVALYLLFWVITDLINLPAEIMTLRHEWLAFNLPREGVPAPLEASVVYYFRLALVRLAGNVLLLTLWSALALWFIHFGPKLRGLLGVAEQVESTETPDTPE